MLTTNGAFVLKSSCHRRPGEIIALRSVSLSAALRYDRTRLVSRQALNATGRKCTDNGAVATFEAGPASEDQGRIFSPLRPEKLELHTSGRNCANQSRLCLEQTRY